MDYQQFVEKFGPHLEHFRDKLEDVTKAERGIASAQRRYKKAITEVENHIKHCGQCMSLMINSNTYIRLEDWWEMSHKMDLCDHPKPRYMQN